jgi:Tfp pilus assembly protein PilV
MSLIPAIISLVVLGVGLIFILLTLLTYFSTWQNNQLSTTNEKLTGLNSSVYHTIGANILNDDDIDLAKADELSTLV